MTDTIYVTGAKGGSGATTCAVMLGSALSEEGERTLYVDGDTDCANGLELCGLQGLSVYTLADVEQGACRVKQDIIQHPDFPNMYVLPSLDCKNEDVINRAVAECEQPFDYLVCDNAAKSVCRRAVLVCEPYHRSITCAKRRAAELKDSGFKEAGLILNKVNGGLVFDGAILSPQELASIIRLPLWGIIPEDLTLPVGKIKQSTKKAFAMAAEVITGKGKKVYGVVKPYVGVSGMIRRRMRAKI